jgi:hypothetical protein
MPITSDGLTPLLRRLKKQIVAEGSFSCFVEKAGVEEVVKAYAAGRGVDACELMAAWAGTPGRMTLAGKRAPLSPLLSDDDPLKDPDDDDDNDEMQQDTKLCPSCRGLGMGADGRVCEQCHGEGRVPADDVDDDDSDESKGMVSYAEFEDEW